MNEANDRAHVSEQLALYVRGELSASDFESVESHLVECEACRSELAGLRPLLETADVRLDDSERTRLRAAVAEALDPTEAPDEDPLGVWLPPRKSIWSRFAPSLGAAALLLVAVIAGLTVSGGGSDEDGGGGDSATRAVEAPAEEGAGGGAGAQDEDVNDTSSKGGRDLPAAKPKEDVLESHSTDGESYAFAGPKPHFESLTRASRDLESDSLSEVVSQNYWARFADAYTVRDARRYAGESLLALKDVAPDNLRGRINWCANNVRSTFDEPLFTAYGSIGIFDTPNTLVLGFLFSESDRGPLTRYMLRAWDGNCNSGFRYISGELD